MKVIRYFKELLATLKRIEAHLDKLAGCVHFRRHGGHGDSASLSTKHWNDNH